MAMIPMAGMVEERNGLSPTRGKRWALRELVEEAKLYQENFRITIITNRDDLVASLWTVVSWRAVV